MILTAQNYLMSIKLDGFMEIDYHKSKIGIMGHFPNGIGDAIIKSSFAENFFKNYENKVIDLENHWIYDYNPYIKRNESPDFIFNFFSDQIKIIHASKRLEHKSHAAEYCWNYNLPKLFLRHPRLYRFEDTELFFNRVVVHTQGKTNSELPKYILDKISENYKNFEIIQIGLSHEPKVKGSIDKTGLSIWESIEIIASSSIFIGIDSGFYHAANCYPRVRKKIILSHCENELHKFRPMDLNNNYEWLDYNIEYFNKYNFDIGATYSFTKI